MFWISILGIFIAAALVKLGVALVMVSILTTALWAAGACLVALVAASIWHLRRR